MDLDPDCARSTAAAGSTCPDLADDPIEMFERWLAAGASTRGCTSPTRWCSRPRRRTVGRRAGWCCSRASGPTGFVFFTNHASRKGDELAANPHCALLFPWHPLERQVRVEGVARRCWPAPRSRPTSTPGPRGAQLGAWASAQSRAGRLARRARGVVRRGPRSASAGRAAARCRCRRTGAATASCPRSWSSGRGGRAGCTTGWSTGATAPAGRRAARAVADAIDGEPRSGGSSSRLEAVRPSGRDRPELAVRSEQAACTLCRVVAIDACCARCGRAWTASAVTAGTVAEGQPASRCNEPTYADRIGLDTSRSAFVSECSLT